jgi:hypothetical protein
MSICFVPFLTIAPMVLKVLFGGCSAGLYQDTDPFGPAMLLNIVSIDTPSMVAFFKGSISEAAQLTHNTKEIKPAKIFFIQPLFLVL